MDHDCPRRNPTKPLVGILQKVARIHQQTEIGGIDGFGYPEHPFHGSGQTPVVLNGKGYACSGCMRQALLKTLDAPSETLLLSISRKYRFLPARLHQVIERCDGVPPSRIDANTGNPEQGGDIDALDCVFDLSASDSRIGIDKILMNGEAYQRDAVSEGMLFEVGQIGPVLCGERLLFGDIHLTVQDIHPFSTQGRSPFDDLVNSHFGISKMPIGVGGNSQSDPGPDRHRGSTFNRGGHGRCSRQGNSGGTG